MNDFERKGGRLVIEKVTVSRLDTISKENDLTLVAVGRGPLAKLFERDGNRSVYEKPQRKLAMVLVTDANPMRFEGIPFLPIKINFLAKYGEAFWMPYYHKKHGASWSLLFEAKPGGKMDRFDDCKSGTEIVEKAKEVIKELMPYDYAWCKDLKLSDKLGWVKGEVTPTIRNPIGKLPSGRSVMALGDTLISMDPIGGQGANLGNKQVKHFVQAIREKEGLLDDEWILKTAESFWNDHGEATVRFNNALLEPLTKAGILMMISQYGSTGDSKKPNQQIANAIIENFRDPRTISDAFLNTETAKSLISFITKKYWVKTFAPSLLRVVKGQIRQAVGLKPNHPLNKTG